MSNPASLGRSSCMLSCHNCRILLLELNSVCSLVCNIFPTFKFNVTCLYFYKWYRCFTLHGDKCCLCHWGKLICVCPLEQHNVVCEVHFTRSKENLYCQVAKYFWRCGNFLTWGHFTDTPGIHVHEYVIGRCINVFPSSWLSFRLQERVYTDRTAISFI